MGEARKKIKSVQTLISEELYREILYAHKNLNSIERQLTQGIKKKHYTQLEASHELGLFLKSLRTNTSKDSISFSLHFDNII